MYPDTSTAARQALIEQGAEAEAITDAVEEEAAVNPERAGLGITQEEVDSIIDEVNYEGIDQTSSDEEKAMGAEHWLDQATPEQKAEGDAVEQTTTEEAAEQAAKNTPPAAKEQAQNFISSAFGDLFDKKELGRMAIMYLGSRALGNSHIGSLQWAAKNYVNRVDAKQTGFDKLATSGKYTPKSLDAYRKSGDILDLEAIGAVKKPLGNFKTFFGPGGKQVRAEEYDVDGSKVWVTDDGRRVDSSFNEDASMVKGTKEYSDRIKSDTTQYKDMLEGFRETFGTEGEGKDKVFRTDIVPEAEARKVAKWALDNNIPPELMGDVLSGAYHSALRDSQEGNRVRDLTAYLDGQYVASTVGDSSLFEINERGDLASGKDIKKLMNGIQAVTGKDSNSILQVARARWNDLPDDQKKRFQKEAGKDIYKGMSPFMIWMRRELETYRSK